MIGHLAAASDTARLFDLVDERSFLVRQANYFGDFGRTSADVEVHLLPAAIKAKDWSRFVRYASIALNLRGIAEDLAETEILEALARSGRIRLAADSASRIPDPLRRAAARAVIAAAQRSAGDLFRQQLEAIERDLEAPLASPAGDGEVLRRAGLLADMARRLGAECPTSWSVWIDKVGLSAEHTSPVWRAVAEAWLDRGDTDSPGLWEAVEKVADRETLLTFLPARLGALAPEAPKGLLERLGRLFSNQEERHRAVLLFLARFAAGHQEAALTAWEHWTKLKGVRWSPALIEAGRELFLIMSPERLSSFSASLQDPVASAALRVLFLEQGRNRDSAAALHSIEKISEGAAKLHWTLRYLAACPDEACNDVRSLLLSIAHYLHEIRYDAPPGDLRRYLDLIGIHFPNDVPAQMDLVLWSVGGRRETLQALARESESEAVLRHLIGNAERYAAGMAVNQADGFLLRGCILIDGISRLYVRHGSLDPLAPDGTPLLPEEEDEIRSLLALQASDQESAAKICNGIRDPRRKKVARLACTSVNGEELAPASLYCVLARVDKARDELLGLRLLCEEPSSPSKLFQRACETLPVCDDRPMWLLHLAWHALAYAAHRDKPWDPEAIFSGLHQELIFESQERMAALTPDIASMGAQMGGRRALAEVRLAAGNLAALETVPWPVRREGLIRLLDLLPQIFLELVRPRRRKAARQGTKALSFISRLPERLPPGRAREELCAYWDEISPHVSAASMRLGQVFDLSPAPPLPPLWQDSSDESRRTYACRVLQGLDLGGRSSAMAALCAWFHVHLGPRYGKPQAEKICDAEAIEEALARSLSLGAPSP